MLTRHYILRSARPLGRYAERRCQFSCTDHYFARQADRVTLLTAIEGFLAKHNPAD